MADGGQAVKKKKTWKTNFKNRESLDKIDFPWQRQFPESNIIKMYQWENIGWRVNLCIALFWFSTYLLQICISFVFIFDGARISPAFVPLFSSEIINYYCNAMDFD